ncbi:MAG TPA: transporter [Nocardioidaceae bacterium]|nr:transporter [Nocardioidaceae bacterium]
MRAAVPVVILFALLLLAYFGMWHGWRKRATKHDLPALVPVPPVAELPEARLQAGARYFGTTIAGDWLDRVVARGLGARSTTRLSLSEEGLDVVRLAGSFRIPADAMRGARHDQGIAGKVVPPHGLLVVTWQHGDYVLDTGFRLSAVSGDGASLGDAHADKSVTEAHNRWIRSISKIAKEHTA